MLASSMKLARCVLGPLLFVTPGVAFAKSQEDSTFNGIDFYAGRIARGFGGGFERQVSEEEKTLVVRASRTAPFVYGGVSNHFSLRFSNSTVWTEYSDDPSQSIGFEKNTEQFTNVEATYRATPGLWLRGTGSFSENNLEDPNIDEYESTDRRYNFRGWFVSGNGQIALSPEQLAHAYYAEPSHSFFRNLLEVPVKFLSPGQTMLLVSSMVNNERFAWQLAKLPEGFSTDRQSRPYDRLSFSPDLTYSLNRRLTFGLTMRSSRDKGQSNDSGPEFTSHDFSQSISAGLTSRVDYLSSKQILHRINGNFSFAEGKHSREERYSGTARKNQDTKTKHKHWDLGYTFHYLGKVEAPSLAAFLADWNNTFGNRLPAYAFHLIARASTAFSKSENNSSYFVGPAFFEPEYESHLYEVSIIGIYGLRDWLEVGAKTDYGKTRRKESLWDPNPAQMTRESSLRLHAVTLNFANFRYEERFKDRFGWEQIREFDRLYGPLLLGGMVNGQLAVQYTSSNDSHSDLWHYWFAKMQIRLGITNSIELDLLGEIYDEAISFHSQPIYRDFEVSLTWQPWRAFRFQLGKGATLQYPESGFVPLADKAWNFRVVSLF